MALSPLVLIKDATRDITNVPRITTISVKIEDPVSQSISSKSCSNLDLSLFSKSINGTNVNYLDLQNDDLASCLGTTSGFVQILSYQSTSQSGPLSKDSSCSFPDANNICQDCNLQNIVEEIQLIKTGGNTLAIECNANDECSSQPGIGIYYHPSLTNSGSIILSTLSKKDQSLQPLLYKLSSSGDDVSVVESKISSNSSLLAWIGDASCSTQSNR